MPNLLVIAKDEKLIASFLEELFAKQKVNQKNTYFFGKEQNLTVEEFRHILNLGSRSFSVPTAFILCYFDRTSPIIQNTFLKSLENPPKNLFYILTATRRAGILPTVVSRCEVKLLFANKAQAKDKNFETLKKCLEQLYQNSQTPFSSLLKLKPKDKKRQALAWINLFLDYGYFNLARLKNKKQFWLKKRLKNALTIRQLIEVNNLEPEIALDQIFLS